MSQMSHQIVEDFEANRATDDFLDFLIQADVDFRQAVVCVRLYERVSACDAYAMLFARSGWQERFKTEFENNLKMRNRWLREFATCNDETTNQVLASYGR